MQIIINFFKYFYVSLIGLSLDVVIYYTLLHIFGMEVFFANLISSFCAISFVYIMSTKEIFDKQGSILSYAIYIIYHIISINIYSYLVSYIHYQYGFNPLISKAVTVPLSFITNFIFISVLVKYLKFLEK
ncbi:GtrA family protein [Aliarcobacter butzleri]|uniref:GtrA family protein n=1 Tax=Aliarcobacter butzleri TaxID=28197 RepID=UPI0021B4C566|nr:GtrA family protein [Aliarcobacter butzleri]MCT7593193.1 GtrA family protein [Aliarcobacter butzleri]MCT7633062.1 GtrA family protein [Aliarcobacter butzleri]